MCLVCKLLDDKDIMCMLHVADPKVKASSYLIYFLWPWVMQTDILMRGMADITDNICPLVLICVTRLAINKKNKSVSALVITYEHQPGKLE